MGKNGRRFMNEYDPYMQDTGHRGMDRVDPMQMGQPYVPCYMILDDEGRALYPLGQTMFNDSDYENYEWSRDNLKEVQNGLIQKADSIEELADMIGCPAEELVATVESWNVSCDIGADDNGTTAEEHGSAAQAALLPCGSLALCPEHPGRPGS